MTFDNATNFGKALDNLLEVEEDPQFGIACRKLMRIKVEIDITKPIKQGFCLPRDNNIDT